MILCLPGVGSVRGSEDVLCSVPVVLGWEEPGLHLGMLSGTR